MLFATILKARKSTPRSWFGSLHSSTACRSRSCLMYPSGLHRPCLPRGTSLLEGTDPVHAYKGIRLEILGHEHVQSCWRCIQGSCHRASKSTDIWERVQFQQPHQTLGEVQGLLGQGVALNKPKPCYCFCVESTASEIVMLLPPSCGVLSARSLCCFGRE